MLVMDYSGSMQFPAHYTFDDVNHYGYYNDASTGSKCAYTYNGTEGWKVDPIYDPAHSYYGVFESQNYYTYDATNKYWVPAANPLEATIRPFTAKSQDGGAPPAWVNAKSYNINMVVSYGGQIYTCKLAHISSTADSRPGSGD